jgi:hypothetical protein
MHLDAQVAHGALKLGIAWKKLDYKQIPSASIDQRSISPAYRFSPVRARLQSGIFDPPMDESGVLPGW